MCKSLRCCGLATKFPRVKCANLVVWFESVAQLVEHRPFKALVLGSSPSALTINYYNQHLMRASDWKVFVF
jgi:hypothetical protein